MAPPVKKIPDGYHSVTPYLIVKGAEAALEFYKKAFGAEELYRVPGAGGKVAHAELQLGTSRFMLTDEWLEMNVRSPQSLGGTPLPLQLYVEDADAVFQRAVNAGAKVVRAMGDMFYGDRVGIVSDPFGHQWNIATHIEDIRPEELTRRMAQHPG